MNTNSSNSSQGVDFLDREIIRIKKIESLLGEKVENLKHHDHIKELIKSEEIRREFLMSDLAKKVSREESAFSKHMSYLFNRTFR